jgi:hypothetical protein
MDNYDERLRRIETGLADTPTARHQPFETDERTVPVSDLELIAADSTSGATRATLRFQTVQDANVDHYEVWVNKTAYGTEEPYKLCDVKESPASFVVNVDQATSVVATVRTVMTNGLGTSLNTSPCVTFPAAAPITPITGGGTGADNAVDARLNLDVYSTSEVDAAIAAVAVTGVSGSITFDYNVTPTFTTLNYKDHAGLNQAMAVITGFSKSTGSITFTNGVRTT